MPSFFSKFKKPKDDQSPLHSAVVKATAPELRFEAHAILKAAGIPSKVWLDDATQHFGVPVLLQALFLIVTDKQAASRKLLENGYVSATNHAALAVYSDKFDMNDFYAPPAPTKGKAKTLHQFLADPTHPAVGLISSSEYFYQIPADDPGPFPTLEDFISSTFSRYLHAEEDDMVVRVMCTSYLQQIYSFGHVKVVKELGFELMLPEKYRGFHRDMVNGTNITRLMDYDCQKEYLRKVDGI